MVEERKELACPQDDKLIQLVAAFEQIQAQITEIKGGDIANNTQMRIDELTEVEKEVKR